MSPDAYFGLSLVAATVKYLKLSPERRPKTSREISDALIAGGFKTTSKDFYNTVFSVLNREDKNEGPIAKVNNAWGLAEWYPHLRRAKAAGKGLLGAAVASVEASTTPVRALDLDGES